MIVNLDKIEDKGNDLIGIVYRRKDNYFLYKTINDNYYVYIKDHPYDIGDILYIYGYKEEIKMTSYEGVFNFKNYLNDNNVFYKLNVQKIEYKFKNIIRSNEIRKNYLSSFNENSQYLLNSILFNNSSEELNDTLGVLGLSILFSYSSIHLYLLYNLIERIALRFIKKKKAAYIISISIIFFTSFLAQFKLSSIKVLLLIINRRLLNNKYSKSTLLGSLLLIKIILNYRFAYTSSLFYIFIFSFIVSYITSISYNYERKYRKIINIIYLQYFFAILNIYFEGKYNLISIILYPFILLMSQFYFIVGFISIIYPLRIIINPVSNLLMKVLNIFADLKTVIYCERYNLFLLIILLIIYFLNLYFSEMKYKKKTINLFLLFYLVVGLYGTNIDTYLTNYACFINVGQGDCALIHNGKYNILIDTGGSNYLDIGKDVLMEFFKRKHINKIDCLFLSHMDLDHSGGYDTLKNYIKIEEVIYGSTFYTKNIGNLTFKNLNIYQMGSEENINSSCIYFEFIDLRFLFMGDAPKGIENKIIDDNPSLRCDILKVGHHGSNTSTSNEFIKAIKPKEAIISSGENNMYKHPAFSVLEILENNGVIIRRTDTEGSIYYKKSRIFNLKIS